jgi:hypothetical protein
LKNAECSRCGRVDPGTVIRTLWKLRLNVSGMSETIFDSRIRPVSVRSVCSTGVSAETVTASVTAPTSKARSTRTVVFTSTFTFSRTVFLNPWISALTV